jgi:hypothetical protein
MSTKQLMALLVKRQKETVPFEQYDRGLVYYCAIPDSVWVSLLVAFGLGFGFGLVFGFVFGFSFGLDLVLIRFRGLNLVL